MRHRSPEHLRRGHDARILALLTEVVPSAKLDPCGRSASAPSPSPRCRPTPCCSRSCCGAATCRSRVTGCTSCTSRTKRPPGQPPSGSPPPGGTSQSSRRVRSGTSPLISRTCSSTTPDSAKLCGSSKGSSPRRRRSLTDMTSVMTASLREVCGRRPRHRSGHRCLGALVLVRTSATTAGRGATTPPATHPMRSGRRCGRR